MYAYRFFANFANSMRLCPMEYAAVVDAAVDGGDSILYSMQPILPTFVLMVSKSDWID